MEVLITYNPNIPQPTDLLSNSQGQILANFNKANSSFGINHFAFDNGTINNGKHIFVEMPTFTGVPVTISGETALFTTNTVPGNVLSFTRDTNVTGVQMTSASTDPIQSMNGVSWLPGKLLIQWGRATSSGTALPNSTVTFPFPFSATVYSVNATILTTADSRFFVEIFDLANNQFRAVTRDSGGSKTSGITYCWMAIGPIV